MRSVLVFGDRCADAIVAATCTVLYRVQKSVQFLGNTPRAAKTRKPKPKR
jgi:hypothetical protein